MSFFAPFAEERLVVVSQLSDCSEVRLRVAVEPLLVLLFFVPVVVEPLAVALRSVDEADVDASSSSPLCVVLLLLPEVAGFLPDVEDGVVPLVLPDPEVVPRLTLPEPLVLPIPDEEEEVEPEASMLLFQLPPYDA